MRLRQKWNHFWMLELIAAEDRSSSISVKMVYTTDDDDDDDDVANQPAEIVVQLLPPLVYTGGAPPAEQYSATRDPRWAKNSTVGSWYLVDSNIYNYTYPTYTKVQAKKTHEIK